MRRRTPISIGDALAALGAGVVVGGVHCWSPPLAAVLAGLCVAALACLVEAE